MRTKTKGTKITAIFIVLTMLMSISTGIMASEPEQDYVVTYQAEEITDTDTLIEMALAQPKSKARSATVTDDGVFQVQQLLETRQYVDGRTESSYVSKGITLADENGRQRMQTSPATNTEQYYGVMVTCSLYFTKGSEYNSYRVDSVSTSVLNQTNETRPVGGYHGYKIMMNNNQGKREDLSFPSGSSKYGFVLYSSHYGFFPTASVPSASGTSAVSSVNLANGRFIEAWAGILPL